MRNASRLALASLAGSALIAACSALPREDPEQLTSPPPLAPRARSSIQMKVPLAIVWDRGRDEDFVASFDPRRLRVERRVHIGEQGTRTVALSPEGERVVFVEDGGRFRVIDVDRMEKVNEFSAGQGWPLAVRWPSQNRIVAAFAGSLIHVHVIDPTSGRILDRDAMPGMPIRVRRGNGRTVILATEQSRDGRTRPARLLMIDPSGDMRDVLLDRIPAGFAVPEEGRVGHALNPALAIRDDEAIVVGTNGAVARIDLSSLEVSYPAQDRSLFEEVASALLPTAHAKFSEDTSLWAKWIDDDVLALMGRRTDVTERDQGAPDFRYKCSDIQLLDTRDWTFSRFPSDGDRLDVADGRILTYDVCGPRRDRTGVTAYSGKGRVVWAALPRKSISSVFVRGQLAFVKHGYKRVLLSVIDTRNGRVLRTKQSFADVLRF